MSKLYEKFKKTIMHVSDRAPYKVDIAFILGSGLGEFANSLNCDLSISTDDIPGYPRSTVIGHSGNIHFVTYSGKKVLLFQGRIHHYEGYSLQECLIPVELAFQLGAKQLIITNAAGGINSHFSPGDLMLASGFNSLFIQKEISKTIGGNLIEDRNSLINIQRKGLYRIVKEASLQTKLALKEGVYFYTKGPNYETPAEIRFIRSTGADAVGMSSVHEAIYASHLGMDLAMISCISNFAAGISAQKLSHSEVTETANRVKNSFEALLKRVIELS